MAVTQLTSDIAMIPGLVNVYILRTDDGLVVLDTGFPGRAQKILEAVRSLGKSPSDVQILARLLAGRVAKVEPVKVDRFLEEGQSPEFAPDMTVIHLPGHCQGQIALLWQRHGGVLFPADSCINRRGLKLPVGTEDPRLALASLARLGEFEFDKVFVMHGNPVLSGGAAEFRRTVFDTFKPKLGVGA
jgi:glyoxylase-like metal-dependent hydrolase (beta-lactamase superfamily II)